MSAPAHARYVIVGAGIHGLSTAWHLARELQARGTGSGRDVLVLDKSGVAAGASGIACGTIRNNYFQPAMRELMAHNVSVWESDPEAFSYHPVGFLQTAPEAMHADVAAIYEQQQAIGYDSVLVEGACPCRDYMLGLFPDWQATGATTVLHEKQGGYANNKRAVQGLAAKAQAAGATIQPGTRVTGLRVSGGAVTAVETDLGTIACDHVVIAPGPWVRDFWAMLGLPDHIDVADPSGTLHPGQPMWTYWALQEGTLEVDPGAFTTSTGGFPPVVHVDSDAPLYDDIDGSLVTDEMWGIYFKPDFSFGGVQGGAEPYIVSRSCRDRDRPLRPGQPRVHRRRGFHPDVDLRAGAQPEAVREAAPSLQQGAVRRHRGVHPGQLPRLRHLLRQRVRHRGLQPRLQDDRRGLAGGQGTARRAAGAAGAIPVLPLRRRAAHPVSNSPFPWS